MSKSKPLTRNFSVIIKAGAKRDPVFRKFLLRELAADVGLAPAFEPPHPGEYLREDILPALDMTVTQLAAHLGVSRASLAALINCNRSVSIDMAQRLGQAVGNGTRFWMALQMQRDIWLAERAHAIKVKPLRWKSPAAA